MDYRYTQDFARQMQSAEWRAHELRQEVVATFWQGIAQAAARTIGDLRRGWAAWSLARKERRADEQLWSIALGDARVMGDLKHAMSRGAVRDEQPADGASVQRVSSRSPVASTAHRPVPQVDARDCGHARKAQAARKGKRPCREAGAQEREARVGGRVPGLAGGA
jgi:hypothetical protein